MNLERGNGASDNIHNSGNNTMKIDSKDTNTAILIALAAFLYAIGKISPKE